MGQPLISDAAMRGMYVSAKRLRSAVEDASTAGVSRSRHAHLQQPIAVLAALLSQLHRRDTVLFAGNGTLLHLVTASWFPQGNGPAVHALQNSDEECAAIATGMALRITDWTRPVGAAVSTTQGTPMPVVIALLSDFPSTPTLHRLVQDHDLPLLLVTGGAPAARAKAQQHLHPSGMPTLLVDAADAVAVCRVTQECLLRARNGWGGAVIHAAPLPGSIDPLRLLEQHLAKRGLETN